MTGLEGLTVGLLLNQALTGVAREVGKRTLGSYLAGRLEALKGWLAGPGPSQLEPAVKRCVDRAVAEVVGSQEEGGWVRSGWPIADLKDQATRRAVVKKVLFQGQPDLDLLWQEHLAEGKPRPGEGDELDRSTFDSVIVDFLGSLERHLLQDPDVAPGLLAARSLASQLDAQAQLRLLNEAFLEANQHLGVIATSSRQTAEGMGKAVEELVEVRKAVRAAFPGEVPLDQLTDEEEKYLRLLRDECNRLPLAEVGRDEKEKPAALAKVYVDLATDQPPTWDQVFDRIEVPPKKRARLLEQLSRANAERLNRTGRVGPELELGLAASAAIVEVQRGEVPEPLQPWIKDQEGLHRAFALRTALEVLASHQQMVLLGDPGSGKSTFVNYLAGTFAGAWLGDLPSWEELLEGHFQAPLFPARILLRAWNAKLDTIKEDGLELAHRAFQELAPSVPLEQWKRRFGDPRTLVLFDGLDEVPGLEQDAPRTSRKRDRRLRILKAAAAFATANPRCKVLVTCRIRPYLDPYRLTNFETYRLAPLDKPRIRLFVEQWYDEMAQTTKLPGAKALQCREDLLGALDRRDDLREMAGTPLLLTMLVRVNARTGLPQGRSVLYRECIEQLLWEWEKVKTDDGEVENLDQLLRTPAGQIDRGQVERVLWDLAFEVHGGSREGVADFAEDELRKRLARLYPSRGSKAWQWAEEMVGMMRRRGGLLNPTDRGVLTLPHRSFQEYLAARGLLSLKDWPGEAGRRAGDDTWFEALQLAAGHLFKETDYWNLLGLLKTILGDRATLSKPGVRRILLGGKVSVEQVGRVADRPSGRERRALLKQRVAKGLERAMQHAQLPAAQRLEAGLLLSDLHQLLGTRAEAVGVQPGGLEGLVAIPAGKHGPAFKVARYPVTNLQFARFIEAGGYREDWPWWLQNPNAKEEILNGEGGRWPAGPRLWRNTAFNRALQPVVGISWYEALAYCAWLTDSWRSSRQIGADEEARLPSVAQWQRVAAGEGNRPFPWPGAFEPSFANTKESGLGQTTPVNMYPQGATPEEEVFDLAGNVWEWTAEPHREDAGAKVLAGGSWWNDKDAAGTAARLRFHPLVWIYNIGFRLVVVPSSRRSSGS
ncbi:MAG TPA: SUMF1/EgtB/PvdO family nonheme iron enzyme [Thermoanaerobaculia bacterium]|nr:SUMF1/EgtB/PvdO family nonheme iron enzyme [Thermoanaerobaculia bacterium]